MEKRPRYSPEEWEAIKTIRLKDFAENGDCSRLSRSSLCERTNGACTWHPTQSACLRNCPQYRSPSECNAHPSQCTWQLTGSSSFECQNVRNFKVRGARVDLRGFLQTRVHPALLASKDVTVEFYKWNLEKRRANPGDAPVPLTVPTSALVFTLRFRDGAAWVNLYDGSTTEPIPNMTWSRADTWVETNLFQYRPSSSSQLELVSLTPTAVVLRVYLAADL